jgi:hypothetical protein
MRIDYIQKPLDVICAEITSKFGLPTSSHANHNISVNHDGIGDYTFDFILYLSASSRRGDNIYIKCNCPKYCVNDGYLKLKYNRATGDIQGIPDVIDIVSKWASLSDVANRFSKIVERHYGYVPLSTSDRSAYLLTKFTELSGLIPFKFDKRSDGFNDIHYFYFKLDIEFIFKINTINNFYTPYELRVGGFVYKLDVSNDCSFDSLFEALVPQSYIREKKLNQLTDG